MMTNATGERSLSKLKLIKNEKRTCMVQERLNALSLMAIESDLLQTINFDDIVKTFVTIKRHKIKF